MKKLYIVRHSKAVEYAPDRSDFNRCLAAAGIAKARVIAAQLARDLKRPDLILSSPACRALETAQIFAKSLDYAETEIRTEESLYHFGGTGQALNIISAVGADTETLMLFGHNPTFNELAWELCSGFHGAMPTSAVVGLGFDIREWYEIESAPGRLLCYLTHRSLK